MQETRQLLSPRSIAIVGGAAAERVVRQCLKLGFTGQIWPINPRRASVAGVPCLPTLDALPHAPDVAFLGVNRHATIEAMATLSAMGAGGAVCYGSGFAESGQVGLQDELAAAAGSLPFFGPNCYGYVNTFDRVALWPDEHGCGQFDRGAAFVSQSGNVACNLTFQRRSVRMGMMVTVGNQARLGVEDCIEAFLDDDRITTIGLFLEAVRDPQRFAMAAMRAYEQNVPIVALQTGRSASGAAIATSHTGSMSGRAQAYDALFARYGVLTVTTPAELLETVKLLDCGGRLPGPRLVSMSCSGGEASLIADRAEGLALQFVPFADQQRQAIESTLTELVTVSNPFDYHTFMWGDRQAMAATFTAAMRGPQDATILMLDTPTGPGQDSTAWRVAADAFGDAVATTATRGVIVATMAECLDDEFQQHLLGRNITPLLGLNEALVALDRSCHVAHRGSLHAGVKAPGPTIVVDEATAKQRLQSAGIAVPSGCVTTRDGIEQAATQIGYPITLKALGIAHKSEVGAVHVGIANEQALKVAVERMPDTLRYLVESTVTDVVAEMLVSVRRDYPIGWVLTLGFGGVLTELWADVTHLLLPVTRDQVTAALSTLHSYPLLTGFRGRPIADIHSLVTHILAIADYAVDSSLVELEINPVLVGVSGATAVDALLIEEI